MYFLVKNLRTCSRSFRDTPSNLKLCRNGVLNWTHLVKKMSFFVMHPEQLKQKIRERDAQMLCQFFDSDDYKNQVSAFLEYQNKILSKETIDGIKRIKYHHVLSCAQPAQKKQKAVSELKIEKIINDPKPKRVKRVTIVDQFMRKKINQEPVDKPEVKLINKEPDSKKRNKTTIVPIFLKKLKKKSLPVEEINLPESHSLTARRIIPAYKKHEPLYAQILHRSSVYQRGSRNISQKPKLCHSKEDSKSIKSESNLSNMQNPFYKSKTSHSLKPNVDSFKLDHESIYGKSSNPNNESSQSENHPYKRSNNSLKSDNVPYRLSKITSKTSEDAALKLSSPSHIGRVPLRMSSSTAKIAQKGVTTKLCPRKKINMNLKSFSELLCVEPVGLRIARSKKTNVKKWEPGKTINVEVLKKSEGDKKETIGKSEQRKNIEIPKKTEFDKKEGRGEKGKKIASLPILMKSACKNRSLHMEDNFERKNTLIAVLRNRRLQSKKEKDQLVLLSLFEKVKMGSSKNKRKGVLKTIEKPKLRNPEGETILQPVVVKPPHQEIKKPNKEHQSYTYKIVAKSRERLEHSLREKFNLNPPFWKSKFGVRFGNPVKSRKIVNDVEVDKGSTKTRDLLNYDERRHKLGIVSKQGQTQKLGAMSKNIQENLHKPVAHFVEHADTPKMSHLNQYCAMKTDVSVRDCIWCYFGHCWYLLRLPKTTPEGYRVLMYAVRDPDPTKMNFNDVVKGFCMYNDCVLSEDGLQDGYVVIFDMKDVGIGHLARVSLPALKCFMYYIQDAHPCRLRQIHVLNTASWIHHVMRLIVPLVRSELLGLVRFHKGNVPDNFPVEILPMDYGGEAPLVEELDNTTKSLLGKYRDWLIESSQFKADESKRIKKASWWGLFATKSPQQNELDEKAILKNLQID